MPELKEIWRKLAGNYSIDTILIKELWLEIEKAYSNNRYYHNLNHLQVMFDDLEQCELSIHKFELVSFAVFYHDFVYRVHKKDNELRSAEYAVNCLQKLGLDKQAVQICYKLILATQYHEESPDNDTRYFLDADMAILGAEDIQYQDYVIGVRKEYALYPDLIYNPGRKRVLYRFLDMPRIFQTEYFYEKYEVQARKNIENELATL